MVTDYSSHMSKTEWENFQVAFPNVVSESFEDETVVVNLVSGTYFTLKDAAAFIWKGIDSKVELGVIVDSFDGEPNEVEIQSFIEQLKDFGLITSLSGLSGGTSWKDSDNRSQYAPPVINVYSDLQDILLLDPVHDVDSAGWPVTDAGN